MTLPTVTGQASSIQVILWEDIFIVVDDGRAKPADYDVLKRMLLEQGARYRAGLGCLAIIPPNATPPSDAARKVLNGHLEAASLRCICWFVEGTGFQAAMVRAVLVGLRFLGRRPYPTHIANSMEDAITWMLPHLEGGTARLARVADAAALIRAKRRSGFVRSLGDG